MAVLKITDASGRQWEYTLIPQAACTIERAPDNVVVLDDPRASRYHAHVKPGEDGSFMVVDRPIINGQLLRSATKVFINGYSSYTRPLQNGDSVTFGAT